MAKKLNFSIRTDPRDFYNLIIFMEIFKHYYGKYDYKKINPNQYPNKYWSKGHYIHPYRRRVVYEYSKHRYENNGHIIKAEFQYIKEPEKDFAQGIQVGSGKIAHSEKESTFRNFVASAKRIGFLTHNGKITPMGRRAWNGNLTSDDMTVQLMSQPKHINHHIVCPFRILVYLENIFHHLSVIEMSAIMTVTKYDKFHLNRAIKIIKEFRGIMNQSYKKISAIPVMNKLHQKYVNHNAPLTRSQKHSMFSDYPDALQRLARLTDIFYRSGRGIFMTLRIADKKRFNLLVKHYLHKKLPKYHYGDLNYQILPWKHHIVVKKNRFKSRALISNHLLNKFHNICQNRDIRLRTLHNLKSKNLRPNNFELQTRNAFDELNRNHKATIIKWGGLVQYLNHHLVALNHTPGHYPDITTEYDKYINPIEVSLQEGVEQAKNEVVPVITHTKWVMYKHPHHVCQTVFIAPSIDDRTIEGFFDITCNLKNLSIPIIALTSRQFINVMYLMFHKHMTLVNFNQFLKFLNQSLKHKFIPEVLNSNHHVFISGYQIKRYLNHKVNYWIRNHQKCYNNNKR